MVRLLAGKEGGSMQPVAQRTIVLRPVHQNYNIIWSSVVPLRRLNSWLLAGWVGRKGGEGK